MVDFEYVEMGFNIWHKLHNLIMLYDQEDNYHHVASIKHVQNVYQIRKYRLRDI